jgi:hypothetical protein
VCVAGTVSRRVRRGRLCILCENRASGDSLQLIEQASHGVVSQYRPQALGCGSSVGIAPQQITGTFGSIIRARERVAQTCGLRVYLGLVSSQTELSCFLDGSSEYSGRRAKGDHVSETNVAACAGQHHRHRHH